MPDTLQVDDPLRRFDCHYCGDPAGLVMVGAYGPDRFYAIRHFDADGEPYAGNHAPERSETVWAREAYIDDDGGEW